MAEKNKVNPIYASKYAQPMSSDEPSSDVVEELIQPIPTTTKSNKKRNSANKAKNKAKLAAAITVLRDIEQPALASKPTHVWLSYLQRFEVRILPGADGSNYSNCLVKRLKLKKP